MKKPTQTQTQTQTQIQAQAQQQIQAQGGDAMKKTQAQICFITLPYKVSQEKSKEILAELRKRFPQSIFIFTPKIQKGRRVILNINETTVILTFPHTLKNPDKQQTSQSPESPSGFTLAELIKKK